MTVVVVALQLLVLVSNLQPQVSPGAMQGPPEGGRYVGMLVVEQSTVACTFDHPDYAGQTPMQACGVVLACLNDTRCVKTYCGATTIRGGWRLVSAKPVDQ